MPLSDEQREKLEAEARRRGIDPAKLIAAADKSTQTDTTGGKATAATSDSAPPNLYMYHLPFVTVNEVRTVWLKLPAISGGDQYAGEWAAQRGATPKPDDTES